MNLTRPQRKSLRISLEFHNNGLTLMTILEQCFWSWLVQLCLGCVVYAILEPYNRAGALVSLGLTIGAVLRDFGIMRIRAKVWPVSEFITDWAKAEALLQEKEA